MISSNSFDAVQKTRHGSVSDVQEFFSQNPSILPNFDRSLLLSECHDFSKVHLLHQLGCRFHDRQNEALAVLIFSSRPKSISDIIETYSLNMKRYGYLPLFSALLHQDRGMVRMLLDKGAKADNEILRISYELGICSDEIQNAISNDFSIPSKYDYIIMAGKLASIIWEYAFLDVIRNPPFKRYLEDFCWMHSYSGVLYRGHLSPISGSQIQFSAPFSCTENIDVAKDFGNFILRISGNDLPAFNIEDYGGFSDMYEDQREFIVAPVTFSIVSVNENIYDLKIKS